MGKFIPSDEGFVVFLHDILYPVHEVDIVFFFGGQCLIPAHVQIGSWSHFSQFPDNIVHKFIHSLTSCAQGTESDLDAGIQIIGSGIAFQFWVGSDGSIGMAWPVDLRDNGNESALGIVYDFFVLLLGIKSTLSSSNFCASSIFGQSGPGVNLNPPALIISQMEMEHIQLECSQQVDVSLDFFYSAEMAGYIQHGTSIFIGRFVFDVSSCNFPGALLLFS